MKYNTKNKYFCMTIGELPSSYLQSMSYYEVLVWLNNFLNEIVIPTINNNAEAVSEIQSDLKNYVKNTDYATSSVAGVIKGNLNAFNVSNTGQPSASNMTYAQYTGGANTIFISKGTLENVITGKQLVNQTYVDNIVGDINTALDTINGEVI